MSLILISIDQIKDILGELEAAEGEEPEGDDSELIGKLEEMSAKADAAMAVARQPLKPSAGGEEAEAVAEEAEPAIGFYRSRALERPLRPGEVSLDELGTCVPRDRD